MPLSTNLIATQADCDTIIAQLTDSRENLNFRRMSLERNKDAAASRASTVDADIAGVMAEIDSLNTVIAGLPDGPTKTEMQNRKVKADYRLFTLNQRKQSSGTTAVILLESGINEIDQRLAVLNTDIAEVEARRVALAA
jgi:uncharacterized small protein (DUF1192 family)